MGEPKTQDTDNKEQITKKALELEKDKEQRRINEIKQELARLRQEGRIEEMAKANKKLTTTNERGDVSNVWDEVLRRANHLIATEFNSTMTWMSSMIGILNMCACMTQAISGSLSVNLYLPLKIVLVDNLVLGAMKDNLFVRPSKEFSLPNLKYDIQYSEDKGLKVAPIMPLQNPGKNDPDDVKRNTVNQLFEKGVETWLQNSHYKKDPNNNNQWVHEDTNAPLTSAEFTDLKKSFKDFIAKEEPKLNITPNITIEPEEPEPQNGP